jgi:predicted transcriptional regulator
MFRRPDLDAERQHVAHELTSRESHPLTQSQVAQVLRVSREAVNRMLKRRRARIQQLTEQCIAGAACAA